MDTNDHPAMPTQPGKTSGNQGSDSPGAGPREDGELAPEDLGGVAGGAVDMFIKIDTIPGEKPDPPPPPPPSVSK